jgi:dephospho-CoA kinase
MATILSWIKLMSMKNQTRVIALVGMPGSGKSEAAAVIESHGYKRIRFGDITDEGVKQKGLALNEDSERLVREELRQLKGMAAYAILNLPRIQDALEHSNVVIDGLYSWEEYKYLKEQLAGNLLVVTVWSPPALRYKRLADRKIRPLSAEQARSRDYAEIENVNKGGPIAMADYIIINNSTLKSLLKQTEDIIKVIR